MATTYTIRLRRSAAQLHALEGVEREIRASDPNGRRKYLREFVQAFSAYESVMKAGQLQSALAGAEVLLIGDYHALPASQRFAAGVIEKLAAGGRPVALALEMFFARDQHILDEWMKGEIDEGELRERVRHDIDWGYDWQPLGELLQTARAHTIALYGLDCMPRNDLRKIAARDRHAAAKIAPLQLRSKCSDAKILTVLQNVDRLYWQAAGERREKVEAVRVSPGVVCVFSSTPLEKYESYRLCIERWRRERSAAPDLAPSIYNLIDALLRFLNIEKYATHNGTQPRFLVDMLPEVHCRASEELLGKLLRRKGVSESEVKALLARIEASGACYVPALNAFFGRGLQMVHGAEETAHFIHHACRGALRRAAAEQGEALDQQDIFYIRVLEDTLGYFGSRVLYPARPAVREFDLYALYAQPRETVEEQTIYGYREYLEMIDFLVLHKDYELNYRQYHQMPSLLEEGMSYSGGRFEYMTRQLGYMLGSELYDAYICGRVAKRYIRSLFFRVLERPGAARQLYFSIVRKARSPRRRLMV